MVRAVRFILPAILLLLAAPTAWGGEYDFQIPEAEKKAWEFGGKLEFRYIHHQIDRDSVLAHLKFPEENEESIYELRPSLELRGGYSAGPANLTLATHHEYQRTYWGEEWDNKVYEGYLTLSPIPELTVDVGKKSYLWGKGYAWNPAGFINRTKDPDDPELNLEGYTALSLDYIKSFSGPGLQTVAITPVVMPVLDWENTELGREGDVNYALKLYFLFYDTDIDLMYYGGPNQADSFGLDFSRNLRENLEIHGELALRLDQEKTVLDSAGNTATDHEDQWSWLVGFRYLNRFDTTFFLEYYHNGAGYTKEEINTFFRFQKDAYQRYLSTGRRSVLGEALKKANAYYSRRNLGRDYLYLKISQKEPLDILYFTPYVTAIVNLGDGSASLTPGLTYQPWTNVELGWKTVIPLGPGSTEFGEKQDDFRMEFLVRYYF